MNSKLLRIGVRVVGFILLMVGLARIGFECWKSFQASASSTSGGSNSIELDIPVDRVGMALLIGGSIFVLLSFAFFRRKVSA